GEPEVAGPSAPNTACGLTPAEPELPAARALPPTGSGLSGSTPFVIAPVSSAGTVEGALSSTLTVALALSVGATVGPSSWKLIWCEMSTALDVKIGRAQVGTVVISASRMTSAATESLE